MDELGSNERDGQIERMAEEIEYLQNLLELQTDKLNNAEAEITHLKQTIEILEKTEERLTQEWRDSESKLALARESEHRLSMEMVDARDKAKHYQIRERVRERRADKREVALAQALKIQRVHSQQQKQAQVEVKRLSKLNEEISRKLERELRAKHEHGETKRLMQQRLLSQNELLEQKQDELSKIADQLVEQEELKGTITELRGSIIEYQFHNMTRVEQVKESSSSSAMKGSNSCPDANTPESERRSRRKISSSYKKEIQQDENITQGKRSRQLTPVPSMIITENELTGDCNAIILEDNLLNQLRTQSSTDYNSWEAQSNVFEAFVTLTTTSVRCKYPHVKLHDSEIRDIIKIAMELPFHKVHDRVTDLVEKYEEVQTLDSSEDGYITESRRGQRCMLQ